MNAYQIIVYIFFIFLSCVLTLFLTHLHLRFNSYSKVSEIIIHIVRSYFLFVIITVPLTIWFFKQVNSLVLVFTILSVFIVHVISAIFSMFLRKSTDINRINIIVGTEPVNSLSKQSHNYLLSDKTRDEILNVLQECSAKLNRESKGL
jgi:hypothetical protein